MTWRWSFFATAFANVTFQKVKLIKKYKTKNKSKNLDSNYLAASKGYVSKT